MKKCSHCGEQNNPENKVCQKCGAVFDNPQVSKSKEEPLILETPSPAKNNKKDEKRNPNWNKSQWESDPDYEKEVNTNVHIENVELDLSDEEDRQEASPKIEKDDFTSEIESYEEEISLQNPIEANSQDSSYQPKEEPEPEPDPEPQPQQYQMEPDIQYNQDDPPLQDDEAEKEKKKAELEMMLKKQMEPAHKSKGIAYLHKNYIKLVGGTKLSFGQEVTIGEQDYILKPIEKKKFPYLYAGIVAIVFIFAVILLLSPLVQMVNVRDSGQVIGYIYDQSSGTHLSDAVVELRLPNKKIRVKSNNLGFFKLDLIPPGSYDVQISHAGFQTAQSFAAVNKRQDTYLPPVSLSSLEITKPMLIQEKPAEKPVESEPIQTQYGQIKLDLNVPSAIVLIDNEMIGKGSGVYSKISTGSHTIRITAEGYQDWAKNIRIAREKTLELEVSLFETKQSEQMTAADYVQAGNQAYTQGNYDKALENYVKAAKANSNDGNAYLGKGLTYQKLGQNNKATDDLNKAAKLFRDFKDYAQAAKCYDALLQITPDDADLYYYRGSCYLKTNEYDKSIQDFQKATQLRPNFFWAFIQLSTAYYQSGKFEESIKNAEKAKKINPHDKKVYVCLAEGYLALGNKPQTKENYDRFAELTTLVDRDKMKEDVEWKKVLQALKISDQPEI